MKYQKSTWGFCIIFLKWYTSWSKWLSQLLLNIVIVAFSFFFFYFYFILLYNTVWFCHTLTWIPMGVHAFPNMNPPSHLLPHKISLGHPRAPAPSRLYPASDIDWRFDSYMIVYMRNIFLMVACFFGIIHVWFRREIIHKLTLRKKVLIISLSMVIESRIMGVHTLGENQCGEPEK